MNKKRISIIVCGTFALLLCTWALQNKDATSPSMSQQADPPVRAGATSTKGKNSIHRYDATRDPKSSPEAAKDYYEQREKKFRDYRGDERIDRPLAIVRSGRGTLSELLNALNAVRRHDTIRALPDVVRLLDHSEAGVRRVATEVLCFFGDRRGFEYILAQRKGEDGFSQWHTLLDQVLVENGQTAYNDELLKMMRERGGSTMEQRIEVDALAKLLAKLGDPSGLNIIAEMFQKYPPETADTVLVLAGIDVPQTREMAANLALNGKNDQVKQAGLIVLAKFGDKAAQQQIAEAAKRLTSLPQPQNADGSFKPGLQPRSIGEATPAWEGDAVLALEQGMRVIDPALAVPVLQQIAIHADNVRFSRTAVEILAEIGNEQARETLWNTAQAIQKKQRPFEETIFTITGKALLLFNDETSTSLAATMFGGDRYGRDVCQFIAETRGWDGLFRLKLFY